MKKFLIILSLLSFVSCSPIDQPTRVRVEWTAPTEGSPVSYYILEMCGGNLIKSYKVTGQHFELELVPGITYTARVAGVSYDMIMGIYSETSTPFKLSP